MTLALRAAIAMAILAVAFNRSMRLESTSYEFASLRVPASFDGFCIVQISDLHNQIFGPGQSVLLEGVRAARPDMIAITGDLAYKRKWNRRSLAELARRLVNIAPVFFVTGNQDINCNDLPQMFKLLKDAGVEVLEGRSVTIKRGSEAIAVAGIDDPEIFHNTKTSRKQALNGWKTSLGALRDNIQPDLFTLLLSHRPELIDFYARLGFDLVLAGHAHGGQVRLPLVGPLYAPDQGFFPRYTSGMYTMGDTRMIVSRGLGRSHFPFRIFNRPELVVVRLTSLVQAGR